VTTTHQHKSRYQSVSVIGPHRPQPTCDHPGANVRVEVRVRTRLLGRDCALWSGGTPLRGKGRHRDARVSFAAPASHALRARVQQRGGAICTCHLHGSAGSVERRRFELVGDHAEMARDQAAIAASASLHRRPSATPSLHRTPCITASGAITTAPSPQRHHHSAITTAPSPLRHYFTGGG